MARRCRFFPILAALATSCTPGGKIDVTVVSPTDVRFVVPEDARENFCLNSLEIRPVRQGQETERAWRIQMRPDSDERFCRFEARFPEVPPGFDASVKADRLASGEYVIWVDGGLPQVTQTFRVPKSAALRRTFRVNWRR